MKARAGKKHVVLVRHSAEHLQGVDLIKTILSSCRKQVFRRDRVCGVCVRQICQFPVKQQNW